MIAKQDMLYLKCVKASATLNSGPAMSTKARHTPRLSLAQLLTTLFCHVGLEDVILTKANLKLATTSTWLT